MPSQKWQIEFWAKRRPLRSSQSERRPIMAFTPKSQATDVNMELENFRIYGHLRRTHTEVKNSLPTYETIQTEKTLLTFENQRKLTPDHVDYDNFYRCLSATVGTPSPHSLAPPTRQSTMFSNISQKS